MSLKLRLSETTVLRVGFLEAFALAARFLRSQPEAISSGNL
jgi:hypothetical protein